MMFLRLVIAAALLLVVLAAQRGAQASLHDMRSVGWQGFALGVVNGAIPFTLIAWGERHIDSGVAAIANASMPIFVVLIALRWQPSERVRGLRLFGFIVGLVGVGVLAGLHPEGGWWGAAGTLAVVVASASYAVGSIWGQRLVAHTSGLTLADDHDDRRPDRSRAARPLAAPLASARLEGDRIGGGPGGPRHRGRTDHPLPRPPQRRRSAGEPRHLPAAGDRPLLRRDAARRAADRRGAARDGPDPRRRRARLGRAALHAARAGRRAFCHERRSAASARRAGRPRLPRRADDARGGRAVHGRDPPA